ncbi:MAG: S9 family peptidase [Bacteroidetes bacterium]|nr:S9 family peptidase [Bacteroidota bacterium]
MIKIWIFTIAFLLLAAFLKLSAQEIHKVPLTPSDFAKWRTIGNPIISNDGNFVSWEANPQRGDGWFYLYDALSGKSDSIPRGYKAAFAASSDYILFQIKPELDTIRKCKIAKKKDDDMPKDSLGIWMFKKDTMLKVARVKSFKMAEESGEWFVYHLEKELAKKDTAKKKGSVADGDTTKKPEVTKHIDQRSKKKNKKQEGTELVIAHPENFMEFRFKNISEYTIAKNAGMILFIVNIKDSIDSTRVYVFNPDNRAAELILYHAGTAKSPATDVKGKYASFLFSEDTTKNKVFDLVLWDKSDRSLIKVSDTSKQVFPDKWCVGEHFTPLFSEDGTRLFFGMAPVPPAEIKDTIPDEEKVKVDVWHWLDAELQTKQLKDLDKESKRSYLSVYLIREKRIIRLGDENVPEVKTIDKGKGKFAIGFSDLPYQRLSSWDKKYEDVYLIEVETGRRLKILERKPFSASLSPGCGYVAWFDAADSAWHVYSVLKDAMVTLPKMSGIAFYDEENDQPSPPDAYGLAGWGKDDDFVLIYDRYDVWKFDPSGKKKPENITDGKGRQEKTRFRYVSLDKEIQYIDPNSAILLTGFNENDMSSGYYSLNLKDGNLLTELISGPFDFMALVKAKKADRLVWRKRTFQVYPDLWYSDLRVNNPVKISHTNPWQYRYLWGEVELVRWKSMDGGDMRGLLYKPENLDATKKYPMIVYFYEKYSEQLHSYYNPKPSHSTVNFPYYTSNGYLVFIPDISYQSGYPGKSAYQDIVSGTMSLFNRPYLDEKRIGLQGQSWGGYQVAYLVTQTDLFKAAMAGAPVSNMTSAYGGIRWESGMSRMFQYEQSQSRIGKSLWENPMRYIENSPLFDADKINTPLMIMSNDGDGAVPWYQGIELFTALRRLNKPTWLLNYNGDEHNLKESSWGNRIDLTIRMKQFFDHYLKDMPAPEWLEKGIPALKKGRKTGYEPVK